MNRFLFALFLAVLWLPAHAQQKQQKPQVNVWVARNVAPGPKIRLNINTRNVPTVRVQAYKLDAVKWLSRPDLHSKRPAAPSGPVKAWDVVVAAKNQRPSPAPQDTYYSRQTNLPPLPPGVYLLAISGRGAEAWGVVNVTQLSVVTKRSPKRLLVWVTDARKGGVVPNAEVSIFGRGGNLLKTGSTKADGTWSIAMSPGTETLVVSRGKDHAGLPSRAGNPNGRLVAHFQTDRPIYRPGQKVSFKTILRRTLDQGYEPVANAEVKVEVRDPKDNVIDLLDAKSNEIGSVAGDFELPSEAATGPYTLHLHVAKQHAYQTFTVAEYRKPEFKVDVKPSAKRYLAGQEIRFEVDAAYYFGAPVPQAEVRYTVRTNPMAFWGSGSEDQWFYGGDGNLYPRDTYGSNDVVADDVTHTDVNGKAVIVLKTNRDLPDTTYSISCTVTDGSRRQVQASGSVPVYAALLRIGLRSEMLYVPLGGLVPIDVRVTDLDGKPSATTVELSISETVWDEKKKQYVLRELERTTVKIPASGKASAKLPARAQGNLTIIARATDSTGRQTKAEMEMYIVGPSEKAVKEEVQPEVNVRLNKRVYTPGETVEAFVKSNVTNRPILVTVEGDDIWLYKVLPAGSKGITWKVPTSTKLSPNAYIDANQWSPVGLIRSETLVPLPDRSRQMTVELRPDKDVYKPGDKAVYTVRTLDHRGQGTPAEVALSVIDEAIYALRPDNTPNLYTTYWGIRPNKVTEHSSAPEEMAGGAYQRVDTVAPVRQRFEDTAYWNAFVNTGPDGTATIDFEMPGNLTSWRATGRAITGDTKVGADTASVRAARPVMLRLATPRQMVQNDRLVLIGTINNRSDKELEFDVSIYPENMVVLGPAKHRIKVAALSEARVEWTIHASELLEKGSGTLTAEVVPVGMTGQERIDHADALRVNVRVAPDGVESRIVEGGTVGAQSSSVIELPEDKIEPASVVRIRVWAGLRPVLEEAADRVLRSYRYGTMIAADQLRVATAMGLSSRSDEVREATAMLSRTQNNDGWGWWEGAPSDPLITAHVLEAINDAWNMADSFISQGMRDFAWNAAKLQFDRTQLWEHKAVLASALTLAKVDKGLPLLREVARRGINLSPYSRLKMVEAFAGAAATDEAKHWLEDVLKDVSTGPTVTYLPVGFGIGWRASEVETNAQAVVALHKMGMNSKLQSAIVRWLAMPRRNRWHSEDEKTGIVLALLRYLNDHPDATSLGDTQIRFNDVAVEVKPEKVGNAVTALVPRSAIKPGRNVLDVQRSSGGEAFYEVDARVFRPIAEENETGIRVIRRFEVRNSAGVWQELDRPVIPGEPVRCTVVVWGDSVDDAVRVVEPIPAGFEYMDEEYGGFRARQEVRDGAVIHYLVPGGTPVHFRYYIRAESEGRLVATPAFAEVIRRPNSRGQSSRIVIEVKKR